MTDPWMFGSFGGKGARRARAISRKKMGTRILMMSDTHEQAHSIMGMQSADILLHAGDFTYQGKYDKITQFSDFLDGLDLKFPNAFKHKVVIPGNHDLTFESDWETAEACLTGADAVLNQETYVAEGLKIYGEPRQPWFYDWAFNVRREHMDAVWAQVPEDTDILLTHGPPYGCGDMTTRGELAGCKAQREWILKHQPKLVVCGHIHEGYGIYMLGRTMVVNASICNSKYKPDNRPIVITV